MFVIGKTIQSFTSGKTILSFTGNRYRSSAPLYRSLGPGSTHRPASATSYPQDIFNCYVLRKL